MASWPLKAIDSAVRRQPGPLLRSFCVTLLASSFALATDYFVAPTGSAAGDGSFTSPWNLPTALAHPPAVQPGDTIWLRGGTYNGPFTSSLTGASGLPIVVRQFPGERATLDYPDPPTQPQVLLINGSWTWYWGFEITVSRPERINPAAQRPAGVNVFGPNVKLINLIIHDTFSNGFWTQAQNSEMSGNIIYYNGVTQADRGHGHGIYSQNDVGTKRLVDNIVFQSFDHGIHNFATEQAFLNNFYLEGNVLFNNGGIAGYGDIRNLLLGGSHPAQLPVLLSNYTYWSNLTTTGQNNIGYIGGCSQLTARDNYIAGGTALQLINCTVAQLQGNTFAGSVSGFSPSAYPANTYYAFGTRPTGTRIFVRPNQFEEGRGHVVVYNWDLNGQVLADLSSVLRYGQTFEIRDAQNYWGAPLVRSIYQSVPVPIPMALSAVSQPIGTVPVPPVHTPSEFGVFVVQTVPEGNPPASVDLAGGSPQNTQINAAFPAPLQVTVRDGGGTPMPGIVVAFSAPPAGASATLSSTVTVTNSAGVARVNATARPTAGSYSVIATVSGLPPVVFTLNNDLGPPTTLTAAAGTPQSILVNGSFPSPLQVLVRDAGGNALSGVTVNFSAPASGASATLSSATALTNASGIASVTATANGIAGAYSVTGSVAGASGAIFSLANNAGPPASIAATSGIAQTAAVDTQFAALQVTVRDSTGNPVAGAPVDFAAPSSGSFATLSATTALTNTSGVASVTATARGAAGAYTVAASVGGVASPASFNLTNSPGAPASISVAAGSPQSASVNSAFGSPLQVTVRDSGSNLVSGATVSFSTPASGARAVLSSATAVTNAAGLATITATANTVAGSYSVSAAVSGVTTPATFALSNLAGVQASITAAGGTPQSAPVATVFAAAFQALVRDAFGNPVSGATVTYSTPSTGANVSPSATTATTNASGVAAVTGTASTLAGSYSVIASVSGVATPLTFALTNAPGPPASVTISGGSPQATNTGLVFSAPLAVVVRDAYLNPLTGSSVTFAAPASGPGATLSAATAITNSTGKASVTATANGTTGTYAVSASVAGVATNASFALSNTLPGGGTSVTFLGADSVSQGAWKTLYGGDGYFIPNVATAYPSYASVVVRGSPFTWFTPALTEPRALDHPTASTKSATSIIDSVFDQFDINLTDGQPHRVAFYLMDWNNGYAESVQVIDQATNAVLDTQTVATYNTGRWLVYTLRGRVLVKFTRTGGSYAQVSGVFFGGAYAGTVTATGGGAQSAAINSAFTTPLQVTVRDASANPIAGAIVNWAAPTSGASAVLAAATSTTNASGVATMTATANSGAGAYVITASTTGGSTSLALTNSPGPPASVASSGGSVQSAPVNSAFAAPLQVTVRDAGNNPVPGATVTFSAPGSGASAGLSAATASRSSRSSVLLLSSWSAASGTSDCSIF